MLSNAYLLAKFRFDTAENEQNFAEILPKTDNYSPASKRPAEALHEGFELGGPAGVAERLAGGSRLAELKRFLQICQICYKLLLDYLQTR